MKYLALLLLGMLVSMLGGCDDFQNQVEVTNAEHDAGAVMMERRIPLMIAAGFFPTLAAGSTAGFRGWGVSAVIHPITGLWEITLDSPVTENTFLFSAYFTGSGIGNQTATCQSVSNAVKDIQMFNNGTLQDASLNWKIERILD